MKIPELVVPGGTPEKLKTAFNYGADAVYAGIPRYSLRGRQKSFNVKSLEEAVSYARAKGKKIYFTTNIYSRNTKIKTFPKVLSIMEELKPDAYIMSDPGMIYLAKKQYPNMEIHLSVQANTMNYASVLFWADMGVSRIILSRELSLNEIIEIKKLAPKVELEVFIHGAICIAHSGRCLMSAYWAHRDANQGACNNACRDAFKVSRKVNDEIYLENQKFKRGLLEFEEDEHGSYLMNSKDLNAIDFLPELAKAGIDAIKVEGRTKSRYYTGLTAKTYRQALDEIALSGSFDINLKLELDKTANRGYISGFMDKQAMFSPDNQNYETGFSAYQTQYYAGEITKIESGRLYLIPKNRIRNGDTIEVFKYAKSNLSFSVRELQNQYGKDIDKAAGGIGEISISLPNDITIADGELLSVLPVE